MQYVNESGELIVKAKTKEKNVKGDWEAVIGETKKSEKDKSEVTFTFTKNDLKTERGIIPLKVTFHGKDNEKQRKGEWTENIVPIQTEQQSNPDEHQKITFKASLQNVEQAKGTWTFTIDGNKKERKLATKNKMRNKMSNNRLPTLVLPYPKPQPLTQHLA